MSIIGIGTDIIEISRVADACKKKSFMEKIFTEKELELFSIKKKTLNESISGNFAAKEAVSKCLGTGFTGFSPIDIEVIRNINGMPIVNLYNGAKQRANQMGVTKIHVSISHCKTMALAYAVAESDR